MVYRPVSEVANEGEVVAVSILDTLDQHEVLRANVPDEIPYPSEDENENDNEKQKNGGPFRVCVCVCVLREAIAVSQCHTVP